MDGITVLFDDEIANPGPSKAKAGKILEHGEVKGRPLTEKQKGFFGAIRGGAKLRRK